MAACEQLAAGVEIGKQCPQVRVDSSSRSSLSRTSPSTTSRAVTTYPSTRSTGTPRRGGNDRATEAPAAVKAAAAQADRRRISSAAGRVSGRMRRTTRLPLTSRRARNTCEALERMKTAWAHPHRYAAASASGQLNRSSRLARIATSSEIGITGPAWSSRWRKSGDSWPRESDEDVRSPEVMRIARHQLHDGVVVSRYPDSARLHASPRRAPSVRSAG